MYLKVSIDRRRIRSNHSSRWQQLQISKIGVGPAESPAQCLLHTTRVYFYLLFYFLCSSDTYRSKSEPIPDHFILVYLIQHKMRF